MCRFFGQWFFKINKLVIAIYNFFKKALTKLCILNIAIFIFSFLELYARLIVELLGLLGLLAVCS